MFMKNYAFDKVIPILGVIPLSGFMEGDDAISVRRRTDFNTLTMGADGNGEAVRSSDLSGEIVIKLQQTSLSNAYLTTLLQLDEAGRFKPLPFLLKDANSLIQVVGAPSCILKGPAEQIYGAGVNGREWTILTDHVVMV